MWHLCLLKHHLPFCHILFKVNMFTAWLPGWLENQWQGLQSCPNQRRGQRMVKVQRSRGKSHDPEEQLWGWVNGRSGGEKKDKGVKVRLGDMSCCSPVISIEIWQLTDKLYLRASLLYTVNNIEISHSKGTFILKIVNAYFLLSVVLHITWVAQWLTNPNPNPINSSGS